MKIAVTGGSGFIGERLVKHLVEQDLEVVNFDYRDDKNHDIAELSKVRAFLAEHEPEYIYHIAAQSFLQPGEDDPWNDLKINAIGMVNLLESIVRLDFDPVLLYTSTGAVYGKSELPHREDLVCRPMGNYGISKLAAEKYLQKWVVTQGLDAKIVRFSSVYGHQRRAGPVNIFCRQALKGGPLTVFGRGSQTRDVIHVNDVCRGIVRVAERGKPGEIYNVGCGEEHSVISIARQVKRQVDVKIAFKKHADSAFDLARSWFDINKVQGLGWMPEIDLASGIGLTLKELEV
jgi:UDP-glucose 4-epimerase